MNPKLQDAVAIFKELGWENVTSDNVLELPLGTPEQKRIALAGLKSGEWGEFVTKKSGAHTSYVWESYVDVAPGNLALFAIRVGVDASRAVNTLRNDNKEALTAVISERGAKYALSFIAHACVSRRRAWEHSASAFGNVAVRLVDKLNLDIPQTVEYMKDWSVYAAAAMGLKAETLYNEEDLPGLDLIKKRFVEHIHIGVAVNAPATGPFGAVLPEGVKRGWLSREQAIRLVFSALDSSVRPGDRKVWLGVLDELGISDEELCARTQSLIPLLAQGDGVVITRLAPVLIAQAKDSLLTEVLLAAFSSTTKKTRLLALKSAINRPCPKNAEELSSWLSILAGDTDRDIASLTARLIKEWKISVDVLPEEKTEIQNLWRETPPVWQIPTFDLGEVSQEALTELASKLVNQPEVVHDVTAERFLAMANAVASKNPETARMSMRGVRSDYQLLDHMVCWIKGEKPRYGSDKNEKNGIQDPLTARDYVVSLHLGKLPCVLSMPSFVDLSISVTDLAARLELYKKTGTDVLEADLFLALTRLNVKTKTPKAAAALQKLDVPVVLQSGKKMSVTAGQAALAYLDDPVKEPSLKVNKYRHWAETNISAPDSLRGFPNRLDGYMNELFAVFPNWGDVALTYVGWDSEVYHHKGLILRQAARRAEPLPPGASINFLAAQRSSTPQAAEDSMRAVTEVWERGLLRPGVADIALLDWTTSPPSNLVALSSALDGIARDGMLSVVWPILDAIVEASLKEPRLLAGTAEFAELIAAYLPEVQSAVKQGIADNTALDLPGIRSLAQRGGSSRAVSAAQKAVTLLPPVQSAPKKDGKEPQARGVAAVMNPTFDKVWSVRKKEAPLIDDGVTVAVDWADPAAKTRQFLFTLTLPGISNRVFQVVKGWTYDLETEGQCQAYAVTPGTKFEHKNENSVYLHWDTKQKAMVVCDKRNWLEGKDGPLKGVKPPLSSSLLTVIIGLLAQDGDAVYFAPRLLEKFIERGQIDEKIVRRATQILLQSPVVSPAKLVRELEKNIKLLNVLWPMLTECIKAAGALTAAGDNPPVWINRILDIALRYAPYLAEAAKRGIIPAEDARWSGLSEIASSKSKSTAVEKAKKLLERQSNYLS